MKTPSSQPKSTAEFTAAIGGAEKYAARRELWRQVLLELDPKDVMRIMRDVRSDATTLSHDGDAFYAAFEDCQKVLSIQRTSEIITQLLMQGMQYPAARLTEILKKHRMNAAVEDIPTRDAAQTRKQVLELLSDVPGYHEEKHRKEMSKQVAILLRNGSALARKIAGLSVDELQKLDAIANMIGANLSDFGKLPSDCWPNLEEYLTPATPAPRRTELKKRISNDLTTLSA